MFSRSSHPHFLLLKLSSLSYEKNILSWAFPTYWLLYLNLIYSYSVTNYPYTSDFQFSISDQDLSCFPQGMESTRCPTRLIHKPLKLRNSKLNASSSPPSLFVPDSPLAQRMEPTLTPWLKPEIKAFFSFISYTVLSCSLLSLVQVP